MLTEACAEEVIVCHGQWEKNSKKKPRLGDSVTDMDLNFPTAMSYHVGVSQHSR